MLPNASQTADLDPDQYQSESRKRSREEVACSALSITEQQAVAFVHSFTSNPPHAQISLPPTSVFNLALESNARPQKQLKKDATSPAQIEQAVASALQETCAYATDDTVISQSQIPPFPANTWNEISRDFGTYDYPQGLSEPQSSFIGWNLEAGRHAPHNPGMALASCGRGTNGQYHTTSEISIPPDNAQNMTTLQGAHDFTVKDHARIMNVGTISNVNHYGQLFSLDIMERFMEKYVSLNAVHDSPVQDPDRQCHPETRRNVLKQIHDWIDNPDKDKSIFWLHGPAGVGKSAIAQTIARSFIGQQAAATFFFYRSDPSRNDGNRLFTTIAWQLALLIPTIRIHTINSLNERPDLPRKDLETQFRELIVKPLRALTSASSQTQFSSLVIIIDGVDECVDEKLQQRFLKVIGTAVDDPDFPLRFLICSRPEVHIEEAIDRFECSPLRLDLAKLNDAYNDIEKYLRAEFLQITFEQNLDPTWPGDDRIEYFVYKSSGHFIYASTLIKIISDKHSSAATQLDIVLGLKPHGEKSPFAELDCLYMEILKRQPNWHFLNDILSIFIGGRLIAAYWRNETRYYAMFMNIPEQELCRKLSGMRSLLHLDPHVGVYHQSFLDFLQDSSRSGQYYIDQHAVQRQFLDLYVASIVRYIPIVLEQPDCHEPHFDLLVFLNRSMLPVEELQKTLQPLVHIRDQLLSLKQSSFQRLRCNKCDILFAIEELPLYLQCHQGTSKHNAAHSAQVMGQGQTEHTGTFGPLTQFFAIEVEEIVVDQSDLDVCLSSMLVHLRETKFPPCMKIVDLMYSLLSFEHVETANRVRSISDGQLLLDVIDYVINNEDFLRQYGQATVRKAARLALEIYDIVPVLPRSLFYRGDSCQRGILSRPFYMYAFSPMFLARILDSDYVLRVSCISDDEEGLLIAFDKNYESIGEWRRSITDLVMVLQVILEVAKAIQYVDSMGVLLHYDFGLGEIFLDSECRVKIFPLTRDKQPDEPHQENIFIFGIIFYELYFDTLAHRNSKTQAQCPERPSEPEISEELWQIIEQCFAADPERRPTIDEIVQEMESRKII